MTLSRTRLILVLFFTLTAMCGAENMTVNFNNKTANTPAKHFSPLTGNWCIEKDDNKIVYSVNGGKLANKGRFAKIVNEAKALYAEFLGNPEFPLSIYKGIETFSNGTLSVKFKAISGRIDRGAGIAFNIKPNGDYLVIRANPLENNIIAFKMKNGSRSAVQEAGDIPLKSKKWYTLKVVIKGNQVEGYLNNKRYISLKLKNNIEGKIGLWSKSDSHVFFDNFTVQSN